MPVSIFKFPCGVLFRKKLQKSHERAFGIEIEMEPKEQGRDYWGGDFPYSYWGFKPDGSLRNNGREMVSSILTPETLGAAFKEIRENVKWNLLSSTSPRTSIHVHLNFNNRPYMEVITFYSLYVLLEDILTKYCGHSREGNIFAIESSKGMYVHNFLKRNISTQEIRGIDNAYRYSAINMASLSRFGTVEMRSMRGLTNPDDILDWTNILLELREFCRNKTPADIAKVFETDPGSLLPKTLSLWCVDNKVRWLDMMTSQFSIFYDLIAEHPSQWDMENPACDFRNEPGLLEHFGIPEKEAYTASRDHLKNYLRGKKDKLPFNGIILDRPDFDAPDGQQMPRPRAPRAQEPNWAMDFADLVQPAGMRLGDIGMPAWARAGVAAREAVPIIVAQDQIIRDDDIEAP